MLYHAGPEQDHVPGEQNPRRNPQHAVLPNSFVPVVRLRAGILRWNGWNRNVQAGNALPDQSATGQRAESVGDWERKLLRSAGQLRGAGGLSTALVFHVEPHPKVSWFLQCVTYNSWNGNYQFIYNILGMVFMYALPLLTIICSYASIYMEIFRHSRMPNSDGFRRSSIDVLGRAKRRTLKMTITIVTVFAICWTPYYVMSVWYWLDASSAYSVDQRVQKGLFLFACTNSCMNPIVYGVYNIKLRKGRNSVNARPGQSSVKLKNITKYTHHSESVQSATCKHHALKDVDDPAIKIV
uniref:Gonadotropin-releasing hormone II receptor n=1 Tax=Culex pipiens TaxID=7175 RepID=A0A8D8FMS2_CULPI